MKKTIYFLIIISLLLSCKNSPEHLTDPPLTTTNITQNKNHHAQLFSIKQYKDYKEIIVNNPWQSGSTYAKYILIPQKEKLPSKLPSDGIIIRTPVQKIICLATPHIGVLDKLDATEKIVGVEKASYVYNSHVKSNIKKGLVKEVGTSASVNVESMIALDADIITASGFQVKNKDLELAEKSGLKVIYNIDWMEKSPLARAEWIKFMAAFIDKDLVAQNIFNQIEKTYNEVAKIAKQQTTKPSILMGRKWKGTWNTTAGNSYFAHYLRDAGADYYWFRDTTSGSLMLSFEEIVDKQLHTDIWINPGNARTIASLLEEDERYSILQPIINKEIYGYFNQLNDEGTNAYWEIGALNPHLILSDLIKIFHPELLKNHELVFYKKLE